MGTHRATKDRRVGHNRDVVSHAATPWRDRSDGQLDAGEELAVRQWHDAHAGALHAWSTRRFADEREAEEAVQDTLVLAWRKRDQYDPDRGTERAWLFGILRNVSASRHRSRHRHLSSVPDTGLDVPDVSRAAADAWAETAEVVDALRSISGPHRDVIALAYFGGETIERIARRLDVPVGTVKSRLYYGLRSLRNELEERGIVR